MFIVYLHFKTQWLSSTQKYGSTVWPKDQREECLTWPSHSRLPVRPCCCLVSQTEKFNYPWICSTHSTHRSAQPHLLEEQQATADLRLKFKIKIDFEFVFEIKKEKCSNRHGKQNQECYGTSCWKLVERKVESNGIFVNHWHFKENRSISRPYQCPPSSIN